MSYTHLSREERYGIYHRVHFDLSNREIARRLQRSPSTIGRELRKEGVRKKGSRIITPVVRMMSPWPSRYESSSLVCYEASIDPSRIP